MTTPAAPRLRSKYQKPAVAEMHALYLQGLSTRQVAKVLGCSKSYTAKHCRLIARTKSAALQLRCPPKSTHWRSTRAAARRKMERHLKRKLASFEHVHHVDGDHANNTLENLQVLLSSDHARLHRPANPIPRHLRPQRQQYMRDYFRRKTQGATCCVCERSFITLKYQPRVTCSTRCHYILAISTRRERRHA